MARGLKKSGGGINSITYHTWPASGTSSVEGADFYMTGIGLDSLAQGEHVQVKPPELSTLVDVYLESADSDKPQWHQNESLSDNPISSVPAESIGDLDLYAKWVYTIYNVNKTYTVDPHPQDFIKLESGDVFFKWGGE